MQIVIRVLKAASLFRIEPDSYVKASLGSASSTGAQTSLVAQGYFFIPARTVQTHLQDRIRVGSFLQFFSVSSFVVRR